MRVPGLLLAFVLLASCGGGGGGGGIVPGDQALGGLWVGSLVISGVPGSQEFVGISTDDGRFRFISVASGGQFAGLAQAQGSSVTGAGDGFAPLGTTWKDGTTVTTVTMKGTLRQRESFIGSWTAGTGESGSFDLAYDSDYEKDSSLTLLAGVWTVYDDNLNPIATFTIEANGQFSAQNVNGCSSLGEISIIDSKANVYDIVSTIANCGIAGDYAGLGALGSIVKPNDAFVFSVNNDVRALLLGLER